MAQWAPFLAVVAALTLLLLVLSRQSQAFIHEFVERDEHDVNSPENDADATAGPDGPGAYDVVDAAPDSDGSEDVVDAAPDSDGSEDVVDAALGSDGSDAAADATAGSGRAVTPAETGDGTVGSQAEQEPVQAGQELELTSTVMLVNVASTQALFAGAVLVAAWYFSIPAAALGVTAGPLTGGAPGVGVGLGLGLALWLANELSTTAADAVGAAYDETVRELLAPESPRGWVGLLVVVLPLIAAAEELLFRAALIGVPAAGFGVSPWLLAVVASLAFALGHGAQGTVGIVVTGVLGFALAAGFILTDSLLVVVVAHYVINAMEFLVHEFFEMEPLPLLAPSSG